MTRVRRTPAPSEVGRPRTLRSTRTDSTCGWMLMVFSGLDCTGAWGPRPRPETGPAAKNRCESGTIAEKDPPSFQLLSCSASCMSRWRRLSSRYISHQPTTAASDTAIISRVARALILGLTLSRTEEKILIGRVVDCGLDTKLEITTSSSDRVKVSSQPETKAGAMII